MSKEHELDRIDKQILSILMKDANSTYAEIANLLEVSGGTIHVRMKKLEQLGVIKAMHLIADHAKLGFEIKAFIGLGFTEGSNYKDILAILEKVPEITQVNFTSGRFNAIVQLACKNTIHLKNILQDNILNIRGVVHIETFISLDSGLERQIDVIAIEKKRNY